MPDARIFCRDPQPVQAGRSRLDHWVVEFEPVAAPDIDPLMGWTSSTDMMQQVRIPFVSLAEAETYCRRQRLDYVVQAPKRAARRRRSYAENFEGGPMPTYPH